MLDVILVGKRAFDANGVADVIQDCRADRSLAPAHTSSHGMRRQTSLWPIVAASCAVLTWISMSGTVAPRAAQEMVDSPAMEADMMEDMPTTEMGGGDFFSQDLGTLLRLRYNTESYGQDRRGNFDIGTMRVASFEDAIAFFDGQATLSDVNGVGYNLGVGFRWLHWVALPARTGTDHGLQLLGRRHEHRSRQLLPAGRPELRIARRHVGFPRERLHPHRPGIAARHVQLDRRHRLRARISS